MNDVLGGYHLTDLRVLFTFNYANDTSCIVNRNTFAMWKVSIKPPWG
jgi:hypothetical protein